MAKKNTPKYENVLLIDDNELDNFINQKVIESVNFAKNIYVNTGSTSALEFLKNISILKTQDNNVFPQVVFVDINMPVMDGFQFINNLIKSFPQEVKHIKIVILTTSLNPADKVKAESISKDIAFLYKPLNELVLDSL